MSATAEPRIRSLPTSVLTAAFQRDEHLVLRRPTSRAWRPGDAS